MGEKGLNIFAFFHLYRILVAKICQTKKLELSSMPRA
jgi:hypothetical protein